jgi:hypothetical protein
MLPTELLYAQLITAKCCDVGQRCRDNSTKDCSLKPAAGGGQRAGTAPNQTVTVQPQHPEACKARYHFKGEGTGSTVPRKKAKPLFLPAATVSDI